MAIRGRVDLGFVWIKCSQHPNNFSILLHHRTAVHGSAKLAPDFLRMSAEQGSFRFPVQIDFELLICNEIRRHFINSFSTH